MRKGIFTVGFPDTTTIDEEVKNARKRRMEADGKTLRTLVMGSGRKW
jgi:hypothetical protein